MLSESNEGIVVEWRSDEYNRLWGKAVAQHVSRGPIKSVVVPWSSIESVTFRGKFFGPGHLHVTARSLAALDGLPGASGNVWWVQIAKPERRNARAFVLGSESAIASMKSVLLRGSRR